MWVRRLRSSQAVACAVRLGSADRPVRVAQNNRLSRTATGAISSGVTRRSGACGYR